MDILALVFEIDPVSFACGVASTGAVLGGSAFVRKIRARKSGKGVDAKREQILNKYKPLYASLDNDFFVTNELLDSVTHDFALAYPKITVTALSYQETTLARFRKVLNAILENINKVENTHLTYKELEEIDSAIHGNVKGFADSMLSSRNALNHTRAQLDDNQKKLVKYQNIQKNLTKRFDDLAEGYADAESRFDKLYLERIPPAMFQAEKHFEAYNEMVAEYDFSPHNYRAREAVLERVQTSLKKAENHLQAALNYSDTARREAAKMRVNLRGVMSPRNAEEQDMCDKAIVSLMDAESYVYDSGNPAEVYKTLTQPYTDYITARKTVKKK